MDAAVAIAGVVLGAIAGAVPTFFATRSNLRLEFTHAYDRVLRDARLTHYQRLFHLSECVPREWRPADPSRAELLEFRERFHDWYFGEEAGGLFLTERARQAYFRLQNQLQQEGTRDGGSTPLADAESAHLRELASELRHQLAEDVGTAQPPHEPWSKPDPTLAPPTT